MKPVPLLLLSALLGYGQPAGQSPRYEVASIKPSADGDFRFAFNIQSNGALSATGITLKRLIMSAYNVHGFRIVGGPDWVASQRWDVQARPSAVATPDQIRQMLRGLLEERFQFYAHREIREMRVYELVPGPNGSNLPSHNGSGGEPVIRGGLGSLQMTNTTAATFASQLSYSLGRPVIDKTKLSGEFNFALTWTPEPGENGGPSASGLPPGTPEPPPSTGSGPTIFTAIQEQLGLRLKSARGPVEVVVIDSAQRPAAN